MPSNSGSTDPIPSSDSTDALRPRVSTLREALAIDSMLEEEGVSEIIDRFERRPRAAGEPSTQQQHAVAGATFSTSTGVPTFRSSPSAAGDPYGNLPWAADNPSENRITAQIDDLATFGPRPSVGLETTWVDDVDHPFTPQPRPGSKIASRVFSWFIMAAFLAFLGWLIIPEVDVRLTDVNAIRFDDGILTAQPVPLSTTRPAIVTEVYVKANDRSSQILPAGTPVAAYQDLDESRIVIEDLDELNTDELIIDDIRPIREVIVPFDARFVSVDALPGAVTWPGAPVVTVYDPTEMMVVVTVRPDSLDKLRVGMSATLENDEIAEPITAEVISAVPLLGTEHEPTDSRLVNVRLRPDTDGIIDLVPGVRFDVRIDTTSAPDAPPIIYTVSDTGGFAGQ